MSLSDSERADAIKLIRQAETRLRLTKGKTDAGLCQLLESILGAVKQLAGDQTPVGDPAPPVAVPAPPPVVMVDLYPEFEKSCVAGRCACAPAACPVCGCNSLWDIRSFARVHNWRCSRCQRAQFSTPWRAAGECERQAKIFLEDLAAGKANEQGARWARSLLETAH